MAKALPGRCPVLVDRDEELQGLSAVAAQVAGGRSGAVAVTGEAGAGKTRLAAEFLSSLPDGWTTVTVRLSSSRVLLPELPTGRPLAMVLDDAHFLDAGQLDRTADLLEQLDTEAVLLVLTYRLGAAANDGGAGLRALAHLVRAPRCYEVRVGPLSPAGLARMAAAMSRYPPADLYARTGGNPLWAEELLRSDDRLPWTVVEAVTGQLAALPGPARRLACLLAVADEPLPAGAVHRLVEDVDAAFGALVAARLAVDSDGSLGIRHTLVADAIAGALGPAEKARLARELAAVLEAEAADPARIARLWATAGEPKRAAGPARVAAARLRGQGAVRRSLEYFTLTLAEPPPDYAEAAPLYETAALTAASVGEFDRARTWVAAAEQGYRDGGEPERAVRMLLDPAFAYLPGLWSADGLGDAPVERLLVDAQSAMRRGDVDHARELVQRAELIARERGDGMALARTAAQVLFAFGEFDRGERLLAEAKGRPDVAAYPLRQARVLTIRSRSRLAQGYVAEAVELMRHAATVARGDPEGATWRGQLTLGEILARTGDVDGGADALAAAGAALPHGKPIEMTAEGYRRFERGEVEAGLASMAQGTERLLSEMDVDPLALAVIASKSLGKRVLPEILSGHVVDALRLIRRIDDYCPEPFDDLAADHAYALAKAAAELGDNALMAEARRRVGDLAQVATGPGIGGAAEAVAGFAARLAGDEGQVARRFETAAALFERAPRAVLAAESWCDAAVASESRQAGTAALRRAGELCERHRLTRVAQRVAAIESERAAAGPGTATALAELTTREREVTLLAAEGLTNKEIGARLYLSEGTVRNYLSTAFAKLGVSRRAQLAGQLGSESRG
ncbi:MAG TPA: LuxR C-terminal-related transcriptional regulator [Streptosporangiaceae bacterium]|jgi:DNA-binding CsgD family transcriptional regulator